MNKSDNNKTLDSRIGLLCREGVTIYYAFLNNDRYFEHKEVEEVQFNLDLSDRQLKKLN